LRSAKEVVKFNLTHAQWLKPWFMNYQNALSVEDSLMNVVEVVAATPLDVTAVTVTCEQCAQVVCLVVRNRYVHLALFTNFQASILPLVRVSIGNHELAVKHALKFASQRAMVANRQREHMVEFDVDNFIETVVRGNEQALSLPENFCATLGSEEAYNGEPTGDQSVAVCVFHTSVSAAYNARRWLRPQFS
jgi:hypothetical protein